MNELEARVRVRWSGDISFCLDIAVGNANTWNELDCPEVKEAYTILYSKDRERGKIVEAAYDGKLGIFKLKTGYYSMPLKEIPQSIIDAASISPRWSFKPISQEDLKYIKDNCFHLHP